MDWIEVGAKTKKKKFGVGGENRVSRPSQKDTRNKDEARDIASGKQRSLDGLSKTKKKKKQMCVPH